MNIEKILELQKDLQVNGYKKNIDNMTEIEKNSYIKDMVLCLITESIELLNCYPWKEHRKTKISKSRLEISEELIDILKYLLNIMLIIKMTNEDFDSTFSRVHSRNWDRLKSNY